MGFINQQLNFFTVILNHLINTKQPNSFLNYLDVLYLWMQELALNQAVTII
jgi:hypothetical protein